MGRQVLATDLGNLEIRTEADRLVGLDFTAAPPTRPAPAPDPLVQALRRYSRGQPERFEGIDVDLRSATPFQRQVYEATRAIPWGKVATYGQIAKMIGRPRAPRAVGQALGASPIVIVIPCHRVVASHGLGGYGGELSRKRQLLRLEGALR